jgi:hypothetical protein
MILLEKSLMVLEQGVIEGRKVFANILKFIRMGASSNFNNMFSVLGASIFVPFRCQEAWRSRETLRSSPDTPEPGARIAKSGIAGVPAG